jgi:FkbM family methyltransferase
MSALRTKARLAIRRWTGFDVQRHSIHTSPDAQLRKVFEHLGIDLVFDIGANEGQYARSLRDNGYTGRIVSFEPLAAAHAKLAAASRGDPKWQAAPPIALGDAPGQATLHVAGNSASSSLLNMLSAHTRAAPGSAYVASEGVRVARLDDVAERYLRDARSLLVKIDTQGYEDRVIAGGTATLRRAAAIQVELSMLPLYEGQSLFEDMLERIAALGFELFSILPVFVDPESGRTLQVDGVFRRKAGA